MASGRLDRIRAVRTPPVITAQTTNRNDLLEATRELAQTQLLAQIADETSLDGRTVGILAFLGALLAVDVAAKDILGTWWWTPLVGVGLATLPCLRSILSKDTDLGPLSVTFYATYGGHPSTAAREQLLADLADAFENNAARVKTKRSSLRWALAIIAAGLIGASLMITLNRPTTITSHGQHGKSATSNASSARVDSGSGPFPAASRRS
ncbi:MAG: hypothetical protein WAN22_12925 [Solirubrobacteraceae bacterium]